MEETKEAIEAMKVAIGEDTFRKCNDEIYACVSDNEKQGFIYGFQYAVSLLASGKAVAI